MDRVEELIASDIDESVSPEKIHAIGIFATTIFLADYVALLQQPMASIIKGSELSQYEKDHL